MVAGKRKRRSSNNKLRRQKAQYLGSKSTYSVTPGITRVTGYYGRYSPMGTEFKFHDVDVDVGPIPTAGSILNSGSINLIAQGTTESTRIGRKCTIRKICWKYTIINNDQVSNNGDTVRVIMYQDRQANGATAMVTDILESANYQSFRNLANSGRFKILHDTTHDMNQTAAAGNGTTQEFGNYHESTEFYKNCNIPLEFSSTTGAITEIRSNNLGVLCISSGGQCTFDSKVRLRYSDS